MKGLPAEIQSGIGWHRRERPLIDWTHIVAGITVAGGIGAAVMNWSKIIGGVAKWFRREPAAGAPGVPQRTLIMIQEVQPNSLWWHQGNTGAGSSPVRPILQVVGDFQVTNTWSKPVIAVAAKLRYREGLRRKVALGYVMVKDTAGPYHGRYPIPPNAMTAARIHFMVIGVAREATKPLVADIAVIDQYNNAHWTRGLTFKNTSHILDS